MATCIVLQIRQTVYPATPVIALAVVFAIDPVLHGSLIHREYLSSAPLQVQSIIGDISPKPVETGAQFRFAKGEGIFSSASLSFR